MLWVGDSRYINVLHFETASNIIQKFKFDISRGTDYFNTGIGHQTREIRSESFSYG